MRKNLAIKLGVALAIAVLCSGLPSFYIFRVPPWKTARDVPTEPPEEMNRVVHPQGFSIILPKNWEVRVGEGEFGPSISSYPRRSLPYRYGAGMSVTKLHPEQRPDAMPFRSTEFQGQPARFRIETRKDGGFENPALFSYTLRFERESQSYRLDYHIFSDRESPPPIMQAYFESFRLQDASKE